MADNTQNTQNNMQNAAARRPLDIPAPAEAAAQVRTGFLSSQTKDDMARMAMAGVASVIAQSCTHPVETVKTRMQMAGAAGNTSAKVYTNVFTGARTIVTTEGAAALYKGMSAAALREMSYSSLRFGLYEPFKRILGEKDAKSTPIWKKFASGASAGIVGSALANPTDVLKVRMQAAEGVSRTMVSHAKEVYADGGFRAFYRGVHTTMIRAAILNATKLAAYDDVKHKFINNGVMNDGVGLHFVASMIAGVSVAATTSPIDLIRTRLMNQPAGAKIYTGMVDCAMKSIRKDGVMSLYRGFTPQWMRFGPFTIVQFMVWEKMRNWYGMKGI